MAGRFYSRKELLLPETGADQELLAAIPPESPGLVLYKKKGKQRWLLTVDAEAFLAREAKIKQLNEVGANQDARAATQKIRNLESALESARQIAKTRADDLASAQEQHRAELAKLRQEVAVKQKLIDDLRQANQQLLKNIDDPMLDRPQPRSPKNYVAVAKERGTNFGSPRLQGGLAGLNKK